jgi:hypothetical protein
VAALWQDHARIFSAKRGEEEREILGDREWDRVGRIG